jgi:hypothetical protein
MKQHLSAIVLAAWAGVTLSELDLIFKCVVSGIVGCYYLRKWYLMEKKK